MTWTGKERGKRVTRDDLRFYLTRIFKDLVGSGKEGVTVVVSAVTADPGVAVADSFDVLADFIAN